MENKEIINQEQIEEKNVAEINEAVEEAISRDEYPKTIGVKAYGEELEITLDKNGIKAGELTIKKEDILLVNRYINMKNYRNEPTFTVVYKLDAESVTSFEFVENNDLNDAEFNDKVAFWLKNEEINFEENDWNYFNPIVNGYLTYRYVDTHKAEDQVKTINALALGGAIAGVLIIIFGAVMLGIGKTLFGATGLGLGFLALLIGAFNLIKKK
ncbi:MAG: hypothetical protein IKD35_01865 [Clostridia bacterium]|nr:hypothetical protein [Clostridia bacterium]